LHALLVRSSGFTLQRGSSGPVVALIQQLVGATPDGGFGALTELKVRAFQSAQRIPATGVVDQPTWCAVLRVTAPGPGVPKVTIPKVTIPAPVAVPAAVRAVVVAAGRYAGYKYTGYERVVLRRGSTGSVVKVLQSALRTGVDGAFGPATEAKVREYQKAHRLSPNGVVTTPVWRALGKYARYEGVVLRRGSAGPVVKVLQSALGTGVDGAFGPATEAKVRAFQETHRLSPSGVVTAPVWRAFS
jgi:peptidoglycan hydrolase-like protein with peptidoglycan-binding domain